MQLTSEEAHKGTIGMKRRKVDPGSAHSPTGDDTLLFQRFLDGDDRAFMSLFHRHSPRLFAYAAKIVGDQERARDILQDVWERMAKLREKGKEAPKNPIGLLITTTRNLCLNHKRDRKDHMRLEDLPGDAIPRRESESMTLMEEAVVVALDYLPDDQREVLILHNYAGYSYEEIASMFGESAGAVRNRAWRGRNRMGKVIAALIGMADDRDEK